MMRQTDAEILADVERHLQRAEAELSIAVSIFGQHAGRFRYMIGSWADYQKAVGTLFRLRHFMRLIERARQRSERWKDQS